LGHIVEIILSVVLVFFVKDDLKEMLKYYRGGNLDLAPVPVTNRVRHYHKNMSNIGDGSSIFNPARIALIAIIVGMIYPHCNGKIDRNAKFRLNIDMDFSALTNKSTKTSRNKNSLDKSQFYTNTHLDLFKSFEFVFI